MIISVHSLFIPLLKPFNNLYSMEWLLTWLCTNLRQFPFQLFRLFTFTWPFGELICKLTFYIQDVSVICSVLNLTAMSMERFYAIVYPLQARRVCTVSQARTVVALAWVLAILLALPRNWIQVRKLWSKAKDLTFTFRYILKLAIKLMDSISGVFPIGMTKRTGRCSSCTCWSSSWSFPP